MTMIHHITALLRWIVIGKNSEQRVRIVRHAFRNNNLSASRVLAFGRSRRSQLLGR